MAPNKKKKGATNPARGFATTSLASKSKLQNDTETLGASTEDTTIAAQADAGCSSCSSPQGPSEGRAVVPNSNPEELECHWEESGLQLLLEQHGERSKKDASRQIARLHTEKRLLRSQADHLLMHSWLPEELMQMVESLLRAQPEEIVSPASVSSTAENFRPESENAILIKLWTLEQILVGVGFKKDRARGAVHHLARQKAAIMSEQSATKDVLRDLDDCLDWLALSCESEELPSYTADLSKRRGRSDTEREDMGEFDNANTPIATPRSQRTPSPLPAGEQVPLRNSEGSKTHDENPLSSSDSDLDDPKAMIARFLVLQSRLYTLRPDLADFLASKSTSKANNYNRRSARKLEGLAPRITKLVERISKLQHDVLFDSDEAQNQWIVVRNKLAREVAERRRLQLDDDSIPVRSGEAVNQALDSRLKSETIEQSREETDEDPLDMLQGLFSEVSIDTNIGETITQTNDNHDTNVVIRDFGKLTGLRPRRVLEEACKARWFSPVIPSSDADLRKGMRLVEFDLTGFHSRPFRTAIRSQSVGLEDSLCPWICPRVLSRAKQAHTPSRSR